MSWRSLLGMVALVACLWPAALLARDLPPDSQPNLKHPSLSNVPDLLDTAKSNMMGNPQMSFEAAQEAVGILRANMDSPGIEGSLATALWLQSEAAIRSNTPRGVEQMIAEAIGMARLDGRLTKLDGDVQLTRARHATLAGRVDLALESFHKAHDIFAQLEERRSQSIALQGLGAIYGNAHDFVRVLDFYNKARSVFSGDPALDLSAANNRGNAFRELGRLDEALQEFQQALDISKQMESPLLQARILMNIANVQIAAGRLDNADQTCDQAVQLLRSGDGPQWLPFIWGLKAEIALQRGQTEQASNYIDRIFETLDIAKTTAPFRDIHETAQSVYSAAGKYDLALEHHRAFKRLDDAGRELTASSNLALSSAQFDLTSKQLEIEQLRRSQLEGDLQLQAARSKQQLLVFFGLAILALLAIAWTSWGYISVRRHRNQINSANNKLTDLVSDLNHEVSHRKEVEADLRIAKNEAERASHAKTQFLANMSHELRTPLNAIIGFSDIMKDEMMGPIGLPLYKEYSGDISKSGQHLLAIVNDVLDMARIDAGKMPFSEDEMVLDEMIEDSLRFFRQKAESCGKTLEFNSIDPEMVISGDERLLRQVVINIVSNAMKFTGEDGHIQIDTLLQDNGNLEIRVQDNGIGIPEEKVDSILEPFGQVENALARSHEGAGLGLPIVKSLVEMHDGRLKLESVQDKGTTVRVILPAERITETALARAV